MEYDKRLKRIWMEVEVEEILHSKDKKTVNFVVKDLDLAKIELSNSDIDEVKEFFDRIYEYIISNEQLIVFNLLNKENNLFVEVAADLVERLNSEIGESEDNFIELIHRHKSILKES